MRKKSYVLQEKFIWIHILMDIYWILATQHLLHLLLAIVTQFPVWDWLSSAGKCVVEALITSSPVPLLEEETLTHVKTNIYSQNWAVVWIEDKKTSIN